jgi:uncharacterized protein YdeI (YjbR/CyaY-like superfamily)
MATKTKIAEKAAAQGMSPKVDAFVGRTKQWHEEVKALRKIALACELAEDLKWGNPCYALEGSNIVLIHVFKGYCAYLFFKGALLKDPKGILIQQTENVQVARQIRFTSVKEIASLEKTLKAYIRQAMEVEKAGVKAELKKTADFRMPDEFKHKLDELPALKMAFQALTPGRQRGYLLHFAQAKQAKTREARIEKWMPQILRGKGLED